MSEFNIIEQINEKTFNEPNEEINELIDPKNNENNEISELSQSYLYKLEIDKNDFDNETKLDRISEDDYNLNQVNFNNDVDNGNVSYASYELESNNEVKLIDYEDNEDDEIINNNKNDDKSNIKTMQNLDQLNEYNEQRSKLVESLKSDSKLGNSSYLNRIKKLEINLFHSSDAKNRLVKSSFLLSHKSKHYLKYYNEFQSTTSLKATTNHQSEIIQVKSASNKPLRPLYLRKSAQIKSLNKHNNKQISSPITSITSSTSSSSSNQSNEPLRKSNLFKSVITVDTSKAKSNSEVLRLCINELGWLESSSGTPHCDIIWQSCTYHENNNSFDSASFNYLSQNLVKINKFPCMNFLLRKGPLTRALNVMRKLFKDDYDFYPHTWFLPEQFKEFSTDCRYIHERELKNKKNVLTTFIVKPNDGSQGDGILLINNPDDYLKMPKKNLARSYIVQEYIDNPFLIDGLKCDLRIYVVIVSLKPLEIYICDEGLVRFATVNYQSPNENNLNQIFMHLTNYSLNKKNESYKFTNVIDTENMRQNTSESGQGSKRKLSTVFNYIESQGYNINRLKSSIDDLVVKTVLSLLPEMKVECAYETSNLPYKQKFDYFQIFGFDILLTDNLKPMLLEVNCNPSLRIDYEREDLDGKIINIPSPIDTEIKMPLVLETLKLVAPKQKLDYLNECKRKEELLEKSIINRNQIVKQRIEQRLQSAKKTIKVDLNKCPLLSKPSEQFSKNYKLIKSKSNNTRINHEFKPPVNNLKPFKVDVTKSKSCLRNIYPSTRYDRQFEHLFIIENISDLFINFTSHNNLKLIKHSDYRKFIHKCNLINSLFSADNLDIIFYDLSRKWELYNKRVKSEHVGICYQGFVEFFFTYSQLNFVEKNFELNLKQMIQHCKLNLKLNKQPQQQQQQHQQLLNETDLITNENKLTIEEEIKSRLSSFETPSLLFNNISLSTNLNDLKRKTKKSLFPIFF